MSTALAIPISRGVVLAQSAWDQFFEDSRAKFTTPNPDLNRDLALDKTIRALGQRPRLPMTAEERAELEVRAEVEQVIASSIRPHGLCLRDLYDGLESEDNDEEMICIEDICDALDDCEENG